MLVRLLIMQISARYDSSRPCTGAHEGDLLTNTAQLDNMSINVHQEFIEGDEQEVPYHPIGRLSQVVPQNKRKNQQRALKRRVFEKRVTKGMIRKVLTLYNFETGLDSLTLEVLSSLEQLFRLQDIHWPTEFERFHLIIEKIHLALRSLLRQYG